MIITLVVALAAQDADITREAFAAAVDNRFAAIDANGDGKLQTSELDAAQARITARLQDRRKEAAKANFAATDTNGNGQISLEEWQAAAARRPLRVWTGAELLASLDADRDGEVSPDEYRASQLGQFDERDDDDDGKLADSER